MKDHPSPGAAVEAKRRPGLSEPWRAARLVRFEGRRPVVVFVGERDEIEAHKVRLPKERKAKVRRPVNAAGMGRAPIEIQIPDVEGAGPDSAEAAHLPVIDPETPAVFSLTAKSRPVPKPAPPAESPAFLAWVRLGECINPGCPGLGRIDPHHEGAGLVPKGVSQKIADHLTVSLCRRCHEAVTGIPGKRGGCLPDPEATHHERRLILRSREESLGILRRALDERLTLALSLLPREERIKVLARALALVPEDVLRGALLGAGSDAA